MGDGEIEGEGEGVRVRLRVRVSGREWGAPHGPMAGKDLGKR